MKCALIQSHAGQFSCAHLCRILDLPRSIFYDWKASVGSARKQSDAALAVQVQQVFEANKGRYGAPRITKLLRAQGQAVGKKRVARQMRSLGLRAKAAVKFKATTNSNHRLPVADNLLQQDFTATKPNEKWVSDITYIATDEGWLYLAVVLDLYARCVVGWSMNERMTSTLVCDALTMALWRRKMPAGVILHSDRGSQYCSRDYQALIRDHKLVCSMSKKGDCYDNAAMESWNHSLKVEAVHGERFRTREQAKTQVFDYIEVYYNKARLHSRLGYQTPEAFESQHVA